MHTAALLMDSYAAAMVEEGLKTDSSSGTHVLFARLLLFSSFSPFASLLSFSALPTQAGSE